MRHAPTPVLLTLLFAGVLPAPASAQGAPLPLSVSAEAAFKSRYLFAGIPFAEDEVLQAKVVVGAGAFTFNGFSVYGVEEGDVIEADVWGDYYVQLAPQVGAFVGAALYNFELADGWEATPELYGGLTVAVPLNPTLYVAHDFHLGDGSHILFSLSHAVPLGTSGATLGAATNVDYNDDYWVAGSSFAFVDLVLSLGLPVGNVTLTPMFQVQRAIDEERFGDFELFGLTASVAF